MFDKNILLVIDLQQQFKDKNDNYKKCLEYLEKNCIAYDEIVFTLFSQFIGNEDGSIDYSDKYLRHLNWKGCERTDVSDILMPDIFSQQDKNGHNVLHTPIRIIPKNTYAVKLPEEYDPITTHIDIIGCDADSCVLATAFKLWDENYSFHILKDYIFTTSPKIDMKQIMLLMKRQFGDCIV